MADSEKLMALKKAYADIILNTAKEAAARIMASERKAQRYQRELFAAKDEALRMLLRLKHKLNDKVSEAEMTSLNHQRRIEELEAQLGEAEDIVKDLRAEVRELQEELEILTSNQMQPSVDQNLEETATQTTALDENRHSTSGSVISSFDTLLTHDMKSSTLNGTCNGIKCCSENGAQKDGCFVCNPDFASIMMRSKEPELYRNGCTQRIRAFEGKLLGGNLPLSEQTDSVKNQMYTKEDGEGKQNRKSHTAMADNMCGLGNWPGETEVTPTYSNGIQDLLVNSFLRKRKRKRVTRYKKHKGPSVKSFPAPTADDHVQSGEDSGTADNTDQQDLKSLVNPNSPSYTNGIAQSGSLEVAASNAEFVTISAIQNTAENVKLVIDDPKMTGQEAGSAKNLEFPASKTELEIANVLINADTKMPDATVVLPSQPINNKILKYTFRRKRKKDTLSSPGGDSSVDNGISQRRMADQHDGSLNSQNSCLVTESSRDSRRLAQVARQLISLSEKKWR